jgi:uncharacterized protein (DUF1697 family)
MDRYVAFLRGVNLGSRRRVKNEGLRSCFEAMAFEEVATFRASGNVIFAMLKAEAEGKLTKRIEAGLGERLGFDVTVFLRSCRELAEIAAREPFDPKLLAKSEGKLQVAFYAKKPSAKAKSVVLGLSSDKDRLAIEGRELYWLPSAGISESDLDWKPIDAALGQGTMRTMGTVEQIAAKYC